MVKDSDGVKKIPVVRNDKLPLWFPIGISLPLTTILFFLAAAPCGVGHGDCRLFVVFFPMALVPEFLGLMKAMPQSALIMGLVQFPLYAVVLSVANRKGQTILAVLFLLVLHASLAIFGYLS